MTLFPTTYFGNLQYYQNYVRFNHVSIEAHSSFQKQSLSNRCEILTSNGIQALTIPVIRKNGSKTLMCEIEISYLTDWRKDHWKAIESAYANSPYFEHYSSEIHALIYQDESNLLRFNLNIHQRICSWLGLNENIHFSTDFTPISSDADLRLLLNDKNTRNFNSSQKYVQVFQDKFDFVDNLSILDAICALGPMARRVIRY
jgi:hypothetical protein